MRKNEIEYLEKLHGFFSSPPEGVEVKIFQRQGEFTQREVMLETACGCFGAWIAYDMQLGVDPEDKEDDYEDYYENPRLRYTFIEGQNDFRYNLSTATRERLREIADVDSLFGLRAWKVQPAEALEILIKEMKEEA